MKLSTYITIIVGVEALLCVSEVAHAQGIPLRINQQGQLFDNTMMPVSGSHTMTFSIYANAAGGVALWTEQQTLTFDSGYYATTLGTSTAFPSSLFGNGTLYLGVAVD